MTERDDFHLTPEEERAFAELPRELPPAPDVRNSIVSELDSRGLLTRRRLRVGTSVLAAAAAVVLFAAGWALGSGAKTTRHAAPDDAEPGFVLLLYGDAPADVATAKQRVSEYRNWAVAARRAGASVSGEKLSDRAEVLGEQRAVGPRLGGFFIVSAPDASTAVTLARSHPHLRHGGTIVVRPIEPTS